MKAIIYYMLFLCLCTLKQISPCSKNWHCSTETKFPAQAWASTLVWGHGPVYVKYNVPNSKNMLWQQSAIITIRVNVRMNFISEGFCLFWRVLQVPMQCTVQDSTCSSNLSNKTKLRDCVVRDWLISMPGLNELISSPGAATAEPPLSYSWQPEPRPPPPSPFVFTCWPQKQCLSSLKRLTTVGQTQL